MGGGKLFDSEYENYYSYATSIPLFYGSWYPGNLVYNTSPNNRVFGVPVGQNFMYLYHGRNTEGAYGVFYAVSWYPDTSDIPLMKFYDTTSSVKSELSPTYISDTTPRSLVEIIERYPQYFDCLPESWLQWLVNNSKVRDCRLCFTSLSEIEQFIEENT